VADWSNAAPSRGLRTDHFLQMKQTDIAITSKSIQSIHMRSNLSLLLLLSLILTGCATSTPIQRYSESKSKFNPPTPMMSNNIPEKDIYRFFEQGATGFVPISGCREDAIAQAKQFCDLQGKGMLLLGEKSSHPPYILGNFPRVEIIFACVDKQTPR